jgi:SagB-type dehydrogenase family enzyme
MERHHSLPRPDVERDSFLGLINKRISCRSFLPKALSLEQVSILLWSAQGISGAGWERRRVVPSAGATYPLELYVVVDRVEGLRPGIYKYVIESHGLDLLREEGVNYPLAKACLSQMFISDAPLNIIICADFDRTTGRYGRERGQRYVLIEVGHAGQNLYLAATRLGLGTVAIGAFHDFDVSDLLRLPPELKPLYVMPFGYPR